jgi:hypothetical protein
VKYKIGPMGFRFEFDPVNKILLGRLDGRLTNESLAEAYEAARKHAAATDAKVGIWDTSAVTEFAVSSDFVRALASREPIIVEAQRPRFVVAPKIEAYGLFRMFQLTGERTRPELRIVHTIEEVFALLGIQSPHFQPLE